VKVIVIGLLILGYGAVVHDLQIQISIETRDRVLGDLFQDRQHRLEKHHT